MIVKTSGELTGTVSLEGSLQLELHVPSFYTGHSKSQDIYIVIPIDYSVCGNASDE